MKRLTALAMVSAFVALPVHAQGRTAAENEVLRASRRLDSAQLATRDRAVLERYYADDYEYVHSNGKMLNKTQEIETILGDQAWTDYKTEDVKARVFGNVAIVTGRLTLTGTSKYYSPGARRYTEVWVKRNGRWQMVGGQTTLVPAQ